MIGNVNSRLSLFLRQILAQGLFSSLPLREKELAVWFGGSQSLPLYAVKVKGFVCPSHCPRTVSRELAFSKLNWELLLEHLILKKFYWV